MCHNLCHPSCCQRGSGCCFCQREWLSIDLINNWRLMLSFSFFYFVLNCNLTLLFSVTFFFFLLTNCAFFPSIYGSGSRAGHLLIRRSSILDFPGPHAELSSGMILKLKSPPMHSLESVCVCIRKCLGIDKCVCLPEA